MRQHRELLENLDIACSRNQFMHQESSGTFAKSADWCAKKSSGKFIRCLLTLNVLAALEVHFGQVRAALQHLDVALDFLAVVEVHAGQARAALEHLDVTCSYVVWSWCRQFDSAQRCVRGVP